MTQPLHRSLKPVAALLALYAGACTVGPNYKGPPGVAPIAATAEQFHRAPAAPVDTAPPPARWWEAMDDPILTRLIERAFVVSPTLQAANARIREARATLSQSRAALYPTVTATGVALKARLPASSVSGAFGSGRASSSDSTPGTTAAATPQHETLSLYSVGFDAMWEIDLFGGTRRNIEGARARAQAVAAQFEDSQVQLAAEIGQAYVNLRDVQARLSLGRQASVIENHMLSLTLEKRRLGTADDVDVEKVRAEIDKIDANITPLAGQVEQYLDQVAMLVGQEPGTLDADLAPPRPVPLPPAIVPIGDPAAMLRRRPDIRAAERQLVSSNAAIGENLAKLFPTINLLGNVGLSASTPGALFSSMSLGLIGAPILQWNFLDIGKTRAQIRQARAMNDETLAQYRSTVLTALQDAESSLSKFGYQRQTLLQLGQARDSAARAAVLAAVRYKGGTASLIDSLDAERQRVEAVQSRAQAEAQLSIDYIALQKSLGLGWQAPAPLASADLPTGTGR